MTPGAASHDATLTRPEIDAEGELLRRPRAVDRALVVLAVLILFEALEEVFRLGGPPWIYQTWVHDFVTLCAAVLVVARAVYEPRTRGAWLAFGAAMLLWSFGSIGWSIAYEGKAVVPYPTFADVFWLLWYPLMALGIGLLIRVRIKRFELHRWMDGVAVVLLVLAAGFAIVIQPVARETLQSATATVVDFSYPVLDLLLIGAILGVYGLLGWRPDAMWILLGLGILASTVADATFAIQEAHGLPETQPYDFVWTLGAVLIACAAWVTSPAARDVHAQVTGLRAIALVLVAQAIAAGIQVYAIFGELAKSERIITLVVLVITSVQIVLARPRPAKPAQPPPASDGVAGDSTA
jgi:hypothetical protein